MQVLVIFFIVCAAMGGMFFSLFEIHDLNKTIRQDGIEIGQLRTENEEIVGKLASSTEELGLCREEKEGEMVESER